MSYLFYPDFMKGFSKAFHDILVHPTGWTRIRGADMKKVRR
jgi:hypothetical protein